VRAQQSTLLSSNPFLSLMYIQSEGRDASTAPRPMYNDGALGAPGTQPVPGFGGDVPGTGPRPRGSHADAPSNGTEGEPLEQAARVYGNFAHSEYGEESAVPGPGRGARGVSSLAPAPLAQAEVGGGGLVSGSPGPVRADHQARPGPEVDPGQPPRPHTTDAHSVPSGGPEAGSSGSAPGPGPAPEVGMEAEVHLRFSDFKIERELGSGSFGTVWKATKLGTPYAVKMTLTNVTDKDSLERERRVCAQLRAKPHRNVVQVFGVCTDAPDGKLRLVLDFCELGALDEYLLRSETPRLSLHGVLCILKQVLAGLLHLHGLGIIHRDLRGANVLLSSEHPIHVRLADFGVSRIVQHRGGASAGLPCQGRGTAGNLRAASAGTAFSGEGAKGPIAWCAPEVSLSLRPSSLGRGPRGGPLGALSLLVRV
jgi:hypothetical protein